MLALLPFCYTLDKLLAQFIRAAQNKTDFLLINFIVVYSASYAHLVIRESLGQTFRHFLARSGPSPVPAGSTISAMRPEPGLA